MEKLLIIGAGGFIGSISRYLLSNFVFQLSGGNWFPLGSLAVNVIGSLLIGVLGYVVESKQLAQGPLHLFVIVGILGGFTTFSAFSFETFTLIRAHQLSAAFLNIFASVFLCLIAAAIGYFLASQLLHS